MNSPEGKIAKAWEWNLQELSFSSLPVRDSHLATDFFARHLRQFIVSTGASSLHAVEVGCGLGYYAGLLARELGDLIHLETVDPGVAVPFPYRDSEAFDAVRALYEQFLDGKSELKNSWQPWMKPEGSRHHQVPMEKLPFDDGSLDAVLGMFTLEYVDQARSIQEFRRVLKPGGCLAMIFHRPDSDIFARVRATIDVYSKVLSLLSDLENHLKQPSGDTSILMGRLKELETLDWVKHDPFLKHLGEFIGVAVKSGSKALPALFAVRNEYEQLHDSAAPLVNGRHKVFSSDDEVGAHFKSFGFSMTDCEPIRSQHSLYGRGAVLIKTSGRIDGRSEFA